MGSDIFNLDVLSLHNAKMYNQLLDERHITSATLKEVEFDDGVYRKRGYFAVKDRSKYFLNEKVINILPINIKPNNCTEYQYKEDVVFYPEKVTTFRIIPENCFDLRDFIDSYVPFEHTHPEQWTIMKLIGIMGFVGKTFICISSPSHFGKSSIFDVTHGITNKCPVFKPRSVPGVLNQITGNGNVIFDEAMNCKKDVKEIMEEFALQIGGGKSVYINGAMKSKNTKNKYNCHLQSITFLYNDIDQYKNPEKDYFEVMFSNNTAIDDRFLKLKMKGILTQKFRRDIDMENISDTNKGLYVKIAKYMLHLQDLKKKNGYILRFDNRSILGLKGRRKQCYNELVWLLDMYCNSQNEYDDYIKIIDTCIIDYRTMVNKLDEYNNKEYNEPEEVDLSGYS